MLVSMVRRIGGCFGGKRDVAINGQSASPIGAIGLAAAAGDTDLDLRKHSEEALRAAPPIRTFRDRTGLRAVEMQCEMIR